MAEPPRGSFAELVALAQRAGHIDALAAAGVLLAAPPPPAVVTDLALVSSAQDPGRPDVPRRRVPLRANLRAALDALLPANRKRSVEELRDGYLAETSKGPYASRLKTWMALSYQGKVDPWPVSADTIEALGAAFKKGGYRSAKEYFLAAFRHQEHDLGLEVSPVLRRLAKRAVKSIVRGLPGTRLKEAFPLADLGALVTYRCDLAFDPAAVPHATDVLVLATWFMLREIEIAGALVGDVVLTKHVVTLELPLHKTAQGGERVMTRRSLRCACGLATHPLCPVHAMFRHFARLQKAGRLRSSAPLFPGASGGTRSKPESLSFLALVLGAAGLEVAGRTPGLRRPRCAVDIGAFRPVVGAFFPVVAAALPGQGAPGQADLPALADAQQAADGTDTADPAAGEPAQQAALPAIQFVPALAPGAAVPDADREDAHLLCLEKTKRVHRPDPTEQNSDRATWRARDPGVQHVDSDSSSEAVGELSSSAGGSTSALSGMCDRLVDLSCSIAVAPCRHSLGRHAMAVPPLLLAQPAQVHAFFVDANAFAGDISNADWGHGRTAWEHLLAVARPSRTLRWYLRARRITGVPELGCSAPTLGVWRREFVDPYLEGWRRPHSADVIRCSPTDVPGDTQALHLMFRLARRHADWLQEDTARRAGSIDDRFGMDPPLVIFCPAWAPRPADTGDSDEAPEDGPPDYLGPRPGDLEGLDPRLVRPWTLAPRQPQPLVPSGRSAPGTWARQPWYLVRMGPWHRQVHRLDVPGRRPRAAPLSRRGRLSLFGPRLGQSPEGIGTSGAAYAGAMASRSQGAIVSSTRTKSPSSSDPAKDWRSPTSGVEKSGPDRSALFYGSSTPACDSPTPLASFAASRPLPPASPIMASPTASSALVDFGQLATEAGAGDFLRRYLAARGADRTATLALMAPTAERFAEIIIDPLGPGFVATGGDELTPAELPTARAVLTHMWEEARAQWNAWAAARAAALAPTAAPGPSAPASAAGGPLPFPPTAPAGPPKHFAEWGTLVKAYNDRLVDGRPRAFPTRRLAGAQEVLARIHWEHTVSFAYSPLGLGEILSQRTWTAANELNPLAAGRCDSAASAALHLVGGSLVAEEKRPWQPKSVIAICDGLEAIKWAWILVQLGAEEDIESYIAWWDCRARGRNANLLALVSYWDSMAMRLAMDLRQRRTFKDATADIMADVSSYVEAVTAAPPRPDGRTKGRPQPTQTSPDADDSWVEPPPKRPRPGRKGKKGAKGGKKGAKGGRQQEHKGGKGAKQGQWSTADAWQETPSGHSGSDGWASHSWSASSWEQPDSTKGQQQQSWRWAAPQGGKKWTPGGSTIQWLLDHWCAHGWDFAPPPRPDPPFLGDGLSEEEHWAAGVLQFRAHWRHDMVRIRRLVVQELEVMVHDAQESTASWLAGPVLLDLLQRANYPAVQDLRADLEDGFDMLGEVRRAPGWKSREDGRTRSTRALRDELVKEARLGRVMGPCRAPDGWGVTMASLPEVAGKDGALIITAKRERQAWEKPQGPQCQVVNWDSNEQPLDNMSCAVCAPPYFQYYNPCDLVRNDDSGGPACDCSESAEFTSASLMTRGKKEFSYGLFELRAKIDTRPGAWSSWWAVGDFDYVPWPKNGEIDIMDAFQRMVKASVIHAGESGLPSSAIQHAGARMIDREWEKYYHTWQLEWDEDFIEIRIDGEVILKLDLSVADSKRTSWPNPFTEGKKFFMILNLAVGGHSGGDASLTQFPSQLHVDYIRVYQKKGTTAS
ncbi:bglA [Symbiodinium sp. CCMP2592]|nr:bglA [Symbiodinium sp. CCMP2592]